jgi:hypothetical protein
MPWDTPNFLLDLEKKSQLWPDLETLYLIATSVDRDMAIAKLSEMSRLPEHLFRVAELDGRRARSWPADTGPVREDPNVNS